jgi:hypothetical protein
MARRFDSGKGNVAGRITDRDTGQPLFGVKLSVGEIESQTDLRGRFQIANAPAGECTMRCTQPGFKTLDVTLNVRRGETVAQDCQLVCKNRTSLNQPVVLLPLSLEIYKFVPQQSQPVLVANYSVNRPNGSASLNKQFEPLLFKSEIQPRAIENTQYWIRWYPDTIHYLMPVGKTTEAEKSAWNDFFRVYEKHKDAGTVKGLYSQPPHELNLETLRTYYGFTPGQLSDAALVRCKKYDEAARELIRNEATGVREAFGWQDLENPEMKAAWVAFAKLVGPIRARQLAKHMIDGNWDFDNEPGMEEEPLEIMVNRGTPLKSLPEEVTLYTIKNRQLSRLIDVEISRDKLYVAPTDFEGTQWMTDFKKAVEQGMGVVVSDPAKVQQIDQADWLIAVGINQTADSQKVLEEILRRNNAKGEVGILAQDSPTNNSEAAPTQYSEMESDAESYLRNTYMRVPLEDSAPDLKGQITGNKTDSQRLAHILKLSNSTLSEIAGANFAELTEAAAMAVLLWTPGTWHYQQLWGGTFTQFFPVMSRFLKNMKLGEFFVNNVRARGTLPIIRIEDNPYGIVPVVSLGDWSRNLARNAQISAVDAESIFQFVNSFKERFLSLSQDAPKLDINTGADQYETLVEILKSAPVAKRVDVRPFDPSKPADMSANLKYLNCPLVRDKAEGIEPSPGVPYPETAYLDQFSKVNQSNFARDSFQIDANSPLLKRILKYLLDLAFISNTPPPPPRPDVGPAVKPGVIAVKERMASNVSLKRAASGDIDPNVNPNVVTGGSGSVLSPTGGGGAPATPEIPGGLELLAEAAGLLKRVHPDKLETLVLETFDLFSHRLDAWFTGLAHSILEECQRQNKQSPPIGMYGWLQKPGNVESRRIEPQYIQAPSVKQATTAAILRNASLNNGTDDNSGAFQINLSSDQVRKGTWYMDGLRQGHLPGELLGYRLERMIHEESKKPNSQIKETDVFDLRDQFPLTIQETKDLSGESTAALTIIDGEKFLNSTKTPARFAQLKAELNRIKDAAADIALCEAIDANDNVARQGGWMDFLDGDGLPPREEFIRTQRTGDVHGTKLFLPLPSVLKADVAETNPRVIAEPALAHFCEVLMPDFGMKEVVVNVKTVDGTQTRPLTFMLRELKMQPIDLVLGGFDELKLRTRYHLLSCWRANDPSDPSSMSPCNILGPFPDFEESDELLNEVAIELVSPASAADKLSAFAYVEKARLIRQLIHQNQTKNGLGTVVPEELPVVSPEQLSKVDPVAGFELLVNRSRRLRDQLIELISSTVAATSPLKRTHIAWRVLRGCQVLLRSMQDAGISAEKVQELQAKVSNLLDSEPELRSLAQEIHLAQLIIQLNQPEQLKTLETQFADLEKQLGALIQQSAAGLVRDPSLPLVEISQFGLQQALTVFPEAPTCNGSIKIIKLFEQLISSLIDKLLPLIADSPDAVNDVQSLRVIYLHAEELNEILNANPNPADAIVQLKNRLPLTDAQLQSITAKQFNTANYFEPLVNDLLQKLHALQQSKTAPEVLVSSLKNSTDTDEQITSTVRTKAPEVISLLQSATDKEGMVIFTPHLLKVESNKRPKWTIDLSELTPLIGPDYLSEYRKLRPAVSNVLDLFEVGNDLKVYEDKREQRIEPADEPFKKQGNTDFLYLVPTATSLQNTTALNFVLIDQWQEGIPNPEGSETTGIAVQFDSPQSEAPNAVIIATPPYLGSSDLWTMDLLANTLLETIDLMQIRLVGSDEVRGDFVMNLLFHLPATVFPIAFPTRDQLFLNLDLGIVSGHLLAKNLSANELMQTNPGAPESGGKS